MHRLAIVIGIGVVLAACDGDPATDGGAVDARAPTCEALSPFEEGDADGAADPLGAGAGEARAGRIGDADLPTDPDGLATWRDGDLALANDRVAMLISTTPREAYDPFSGRIVGIARVEDGALVEPADFNALLLGVGRFLVETDSVSVLSDGSDGGPAVIRARGALGPIRTLADLLDGFLPEDFTGLPGAMDYELAPDAEHVDVFVSVRADTGGVRTGLGVVQVFFQGYRMPPWAPGTGFGTREGGTRFLAFTDDDATSYAWMAPEGTLSQLFGDTGIDLFTSNRLTVAPCDEARVHVGRLVIGGPGLPGVQAAVARIDDTETTRVEGTVLEADGAPATDVRVHVTTADGEHVTRTYVEADGTFALDVDPRAAQLFAWRPGEAPVGRSRSTPVRSPCRRSRQSRSRRPTRTARRRRRAWRSSPTRPWSRRR